MSLQNYTEGDRNNPYSFDDYLMVRDKFDYYADDLFFHALVKKFVPPEEFENLEKELKGLSEYVSQKYRYLSDKATSLDNRIKVTKLTHYDAHNHRIDRIERCTETEIMEREIFSLGLFDPNRNSAWSRFVKLFLLYENSEFGVMCPVACTHGAVKLMEKYEDSLDTNAKEILAHIRNAEGPLSDGGYGIGAQYVSEIQGGSDVPANMVEAVYEEEEGSDGVCNCWRLYGQKFFCSATQSDYAVVTAKPKNTPSSTRVAAFVVPSWLPGNKSKELRNSYTIDRLKQKLGTAELPTAEITYTGSVAYPIGPLEKGLADIVGIVLSISRLHVAFGVAAGGLRVAREASLYAQFRTAFGVPTSNFPLMQNQIKKLEEFAKRSVAGAFKVYSEYIRFGEDLIAGIRDLEKMEDLEERKRRFRLRELVMLQKIVVANEAPAMIRLAISFFGGHGIMEDFSSLPRFHRDSLIMELWEGPRNVLLTQIHRDFQRVKEWYSPKEFVSDLLVGADDEIIKSLANDFEQVIGHESLLKSDERTLSICEKWEELSTTLFQTYQRVALNELNYKEEELKFKKLLRTYKKTK